jgi:glycosyltransferase involved in cell wall biosynthesis
MNRGGAETMIMNLYRNIDRNMIQFDFVVHTKEKCAYDDEIKNLGGKIYRVPRYNGINHFEYIKQWKKLLNKNSEYKIIHGHIRSTAVFYLRLARKRGVKAIMHSHSVTSGKGIKAYIKNIYQLPLRFSADYYLACSKAAGHWLFGRKIDTNKNYHVLKNAINIDNFIFKQGARDITRQKLDLKNKFVVGNVGRFNILKNHKFLIEVFYEASKVRSDLILILVGDGELKNSIKSKVRNLELEGSVIFIDSCSNVSDYFFAMDLFVLPSTREGLSMVLIEAQASGLPCIVSDGIPNEAYITDLVCRVDLASTSEWIDKLVSSKKTERISRENELKISGYGVIENAKWIQNYYKNINAS